MSTTCDPNDPGLRKVDERGMQEKYLVDCNDLAPLVRPVRRSYQHLTCGTVTTMGTAIAETYARHPDFYGATYCVKCQGHFPVGADGEFVWADTDEKVGT